MNDHDNRPASNPLNANAFFFGGLLAIPSPGVGVLGHALSSLVTSRHPVCVVESWQAISPGMSAPFAEPDGVQS